MNHLIIYFARVPWVVSERRPLEHKDERVNAGHITRAPMAVRQAVCHHRKTLHCSSRKLSMNLAP